jgi:hypothetical protein
MKNLLLLFLLVFPFALIAQEDAFGPQKNDNVIVVTTDTVDKSALDKTAKLLNNQGFNIKEIDSQKGTLSTNAFDYKKGKLNLHVQVNLNEIKIYGEFEPNLAITSSADKPKQLTLKINYEGVKGSPGKEAWNVMDAFANSLAQELQASVSYLKW